MKISIDDQECFCLSETQKKVIMNDINEDEFEADMRRRLEYILMHKYERCMERLKSEWMPRLKASGLKSIPTDDEELAQVIFSQQEYKGRKQREIESVNARFSPELSVTSL